MPIFAHNLSDKNKGRVNRILEVIMAYARLDFSQKTEVQGNDDVLDAISAGVNMLGEELENSTVSLKEKEQLLKEVHHRVKNNLQIVSSLLKLQSENILDERYLELINDSRNRINSMALVHEMLYSSRNLSKIPIKEYIQRLCNNIHQSYSRPGSEVVFQFNIDDLYFQIDEMIPFGLIINEVVSNSFKYAFPGINGQITVELLDTEKSYSLRIFDNGVGLPQNFDPDKDSQLGMQLIHMLSKQMDGDIKIFCENGTTYDIQFPHS